MLYSIGTMLRWFYVIIRMLLHAFREYVDLIVLFLDQNSQLKRFFSRIFAISIFFTSLTTTKSFWAYSRLRSSFIRCSNE